MSFDLQTIQDLAITYGIQIFTALLIFFVGKFVVKKVTALCRTMMGKAKMDKTLVSFLGNIISALGMAFVVIAALGQVGIQTSSLVAVIAAAGLAVGLALQGSLSNLAAGVMIIMFRPFKIGDYIEAAGTMGTVEDITIFTTKLKKPDNVMNIVPNSNITNGVITNYSKKDTRRIDLVFGIGYDDDIKKAKKLLEKVAKAEKRILADPPIQIAVSELGDSSVNFVFRPWVKSSDYWPTRFALIETVKLEMDKAGITIPYPQRDVHLFAEDSFAKSLVEANTNKSKTKATAKKKKSA